MDLPDSLRNALAHELAAISQKDIAAAATALSTRYRHEANQPKPKRPFLRSAHDVLAYAAYRMPATFAAIYAALHVIREQSPNWQPHTLLDIGAGPGTAMWAASEIWPQLQHLTLLEREERMIALGKRLSVHAQTPVLQHADWQQRDLLAAWSCPPHNLVIAAYSLGELPSTSQQNLLNKLWSLTTGTLLLIEPGTPIGFSFIRQARQQLITAGANVIAPCPHNHPCPMPEHDWCHFSQRITRTPLQRQIKAATLSYEDEKFSYVALSRLPATPISARVLRHPQIRPGHIYLELCTPSGLQTSIVTRKDKAAFRQARALTWGSTLPTTP